jgi:hypothetical protein
MDALNLRVGWLIRRSCEVMVAHPENVARLAVGSQHALSSHLFIEPAYLKALKRRAATQRAADHLPAIAHPGCCFEQKPKFGGYALQDVHGLSS